MRFKAWGGLISSDIIPHKGTKFYSPLRSHGQIRLSLFGFLTSIKLMANWFSCSCNCWKCLSTLFWRSSSTVFMSKIFLTLRRIQRNAMSHAHCFSYQLPITLCHILSKLNSLDRFSKFSNIKFNWNPFSGSRVFPCGGIDRHDAANISFSPYSKRA